MPGQPVVFETLGGLVSTTRPEDVPEGASPRTYDTDFITGRMIQRAGLQNVYTYQGVFSGPNGPGAAANVATTGNAWANTSNILTNDGNVTSATVSTNPTTDELHLTLFNFSVASASSILGFPVSIKGYGAGAILYAQLLKNGAKVGNIYSATLTGTNEFVNFGGENDLWGSTWDYADVDETTFGVALWATSPTPLTIGLDYGQIEVYGTNAQVNYLGLGTVDLNQTDTTTLATDANGVTWTEDALNAPGVLTDASLIPTAQPGSYMKGIDANGVAFMAYSDLKSGTSQPMQYNGQWADRITQVGPGAAPVFTPVQAGTDSFALSTITQPTQQVRTSSYFLQSAGPGNQSAGNNVTVYYSDSTLAGPDTDLEAQFNSGNAVYLYMEFTGTSIPTNGPYVVQVTSVGLASPPGQPRQFYYFTYTLPTSAYQYYQGSGNTSYTATYQQTLATLTATAPIPGLQVGNQIVVTGVTPTAWNSTWTVTQAINSGSVAITQTSVASGLATYDYTLISGVAPAAGQLITITNTLNAEGALNGASLTINTATGGASGSFTINVSVADASAVAETGQGVTAGTIFAFDPGAADVGTSTDPIFGDGTGGSLTFSAATGTFLTPGVKQGTIFFITRNGNVTQPANPVTFTIPTNTQSISATLIPIGPPNVVARGISFTESGQNEVPGANFYTYDTPVTYYVNGTKYTASALIVPDNSTTNAVFTFPDSVLLASDEIDVPGNNYFNLREIGSPVWIAQYANRMLYGLCNSKIDNFVNPTFDGGYNPSSSALPQPLGWTSAGAVTNITSGLVASADFGNSLQILNAGTSAVTSQYLYFQSAYQDFYNVNILQPNTPYSVRFKARALNADGQTITLALVPYADGSFGVPRGTVTFTVNQGDFVIQAASIMAAQTSIDPTLVLAIQIDSIAAGAGVQIDRMEVFDTDHPVDTTIIWTSYANNFGAVDRVTGQLGCGDDNPQPTQGAFQILESLYIQKTNSMCVTQDSPNYEPDQWKVFLASQGSGAVGPNAFYSDEEFEISASRSGVFLFYGGSPAPLSRELQSTGVNGSVWEQINWSAGHTIWTRFSTDKRQLFIGVPMKTPNFWLPNAAASTPTSPNVILMCNFTGCPTAQELESATPVYTTIFGDLKALDMRRRWSIWQIAAPVAEFIKRGDGLTTPLFLANGISSSKIYQFVDGAASGGQNTDDGAPINWLYTSAGFVKAKAGQQNPMLGALRKVWYYFSATMEGVGKVSRKFYSNSLGALPRNTYTAPAATLSYPAQDNQECVLEIGGQRLFVEFSSVGTGGYAEIGAYMLDGEMDKNAPHRGVSA